MLKYRDYGRDHASSSCCRTVWASMWQRVHDRGCTMLKYWLNVAVMMTVCRTVCMILIIWSSIYGIDYTSGWREKTRSIYQARLLLRPVFCWRNLFTRRSVTKFYGQSRSMGGFVPKLHPYLFRPECIYLYSWFNSLSCCERAWPVQQYNQYTTLHFIGQLENITSMIGQ